MTKYVDSLIANQIFDLCTEFYKMEKLYENNFNEATYTCYFIDSKSIDNLKKHIDYDNLKIYISKLISREDFKTKLRKDKKDSKTKIDTNLKPEKFNSSQELLTSLNKKKFYCIPNYNLIKKICQKSKIDKTDIKVTLHRDKIVIIFNENDKLTFFNNTTGLIEKSLLIQNSNSETMVKQPFNNNKFKDIKDDLEILIRLYYNYRFLKEKENKEFNILSEDISESFYLISNNLIEKYKSFYEYNDLENYLKYSSKNDKLYKKSLDIISKDYIESIII